MPSLLVLLGAAAYASSVRGVFLFDDAVHIVQNDHIQDLTALDRVLASRRPVVDLSLALNYAAGGLDVEGYHLFNIAVHVLAALTLFGIVRRTLLTETLHARYGCAASAIAFFAAALWMLHPLQTQGVSYVIQRSESMMGLFYLLTLYSVLRADSARRAWVWSVAAVGFCALGMGCKAVIVTAPIMVLLFDAVFLSRSLTHALRRRWTLYAGLAAAWSVLWELGTIRGVLRTSHEQATVGFSFKGITPLEYLLTQPGVIARYLRLSLWPEPLCLDYGWPVARSVSEILPPAVLVGGLLVVGVWALVRRPRVGYVAFWFFAILAPTSTFIPIKDTFFEHRMYLPLASVTVLVVIGGYLAAARLRRLSPIRPSWQTAAVALVPIAAMASLGMATFQRNRVYQSGVGMWRDVVQKRPTNARAYEHIGTLFVREGKLFDAIEAYRAAVRVDADFTSAHANLANALSQTGQYARALPEYEAVIRREPNHAEAQMNYGIALDELGRRAEAMAALRAATEVDPKHAPAQLRARAHYNLGGVYARGGEWLEAVPEYKAALALVPQYEKAHYTLGIVLMQLGRFEEAADHFQRTLEINPNNTAAARALNEAASAARTDDDQ